MKKSKNDVDIEKLQIELAKNMKIIVIILASILLSSCGETWICKTEGKNMFSVSDSGKIGSADKGCSCDQIRNFELREFGEVDEEALKSDFGC